MMGCFLPCFGASKRRKPPATPSPHHTHGADEGVKRLAAEQKIIEEPITDTQSKIKLENLSTERGTKRITNDRNASVNEELSTKEESTTEPEKTEDGVTLDINCGPEATAISSKDEKNGEHEEEDEVNGKSLPLESSESFFSLSIDSRKHVSASEKAEYEVNSSMPPRDASSNTKEGSGSFGSSLDGVQGKPVKAEENLVQGMPVKVKDSPYSFTISKWNAKRKVNFDLKVNTNEEPSAQQIIRGLNKNKQDQDETPQVSECPGTVASGKSSHFSRYRYQDCSEDECGDFDLGRSDFGDKFVVDDDADNEERGEGDGAVNTTSIQEESSESLFSISTDARKQVSGAEKAENEVNSPMPVCGKESFIGRGGRIQNVSSIQNPIENITQGRVVKAPSMQPLKDGKENINSEKDVTGTPKSEQSSLNVSNGKARHKKFDDRNEEEVRVDTSLSSWLVEIETTPDSKKGTNYVEVSTPISKRSSLSPVSHEDRPILGALSMEELRKFSVPSKPSRRAKSRSPDETPIIGTVGSYWSYTGQTINSESPSSWGRIQKHRGTH